MIERQGVKRQSALRSFASGQQMPAGFAKDAASQGCKKSQILVVELGLSSAAVKGLRDRPRRNQPRSSGKSGNKSHPA